MTQHLVFAYKVYGRDMQNVLPSNTKRISIKYPVIWYRSTHGYMAMIYGLDMWYAKLVSISPIAVLQ